MSACDPRESGVAALTTARGSALPFLPTLITALGVAALSLLCRAPSTETPAAPVVTAQAAPAGADGFHPVPSGYERVPMVPAVLAFGHLQPLALQAPHLAEGDDAAKGPASRPARPALAARRPCAGSRCGETRRAEIPVRAAPAPVRAASEPAAVPAPMRGQDDAEQDALPIGTLPFAATAASWVDSARKLGGGIGSGAASLGGSVVDLLASAR